MNKTISFGKALAHCASTGSYWAWVIGALVLLVAAIIFVKVNKKPEDATKWYIVIIAAIILGLTIFIRPFEVKANTTEEQAARGVYIGY